MRVDLEMKPGQPMPDLSEKYMPELARAGGAFGLAPYRHSKLPLRMFEACRIATAVINGCIVCKNWRAERDCSYLGCDVSRLGEAPDEAMYEAVLAGDLSRLTEREQLAVRYSQRMGTEPEALAADEDFWTEFKSQFTDEEIVDLTYSVAAWMALGRVTHVLGVDVACRLPTHEKQAA